MGVIGKRLKYVQLISEAGSHELPTTGAGETEVKEGKRRIKRKGGFGLPGIGWNPLPA
jgi:hypothetical protein